MDATTCENSGYHNETASRRRRRSREERGLADEQSRIDLAETYLEIQQAKWPDLAASGDLPGLSDEMVAALAEEFRRRFLSTEPVEAVREIELPEGVTLGSAYLRYSCDNSNPRSLAQQLRNILERAARDRVFIPWELVFADAAVSGTTANRRGYLLAKETVQLEDGPKTLYVDELGRAARDAIETLTLGQLILRLRKRLVGASDGFDSDMPHSQMMLSIYAMLHQWFSDQLRAKVHRGMRDAFDQGRNIRPPSFGYRLVPAVDAEGQPLVNQEGVPIKVKEIDSDEAHWVEEAFRLYVECGWSPDRIAKHFNEHHVGDRHSWERCSLLQLLARTTYIGIEYEGQRRHLRDPETGKIKTEKRPKQEWKRRDMPHLRIISDELFEKAANRKEECSQAFAPIAAKRKKRSRTDAYPKVLVRPICRCGEKLQLGRSSEKYASFCCPNGSKRKHGCTLKTYKSVSMVTATILGWIKDNLFTAELVNKIVDQANAALAEEASKPSEDMQPIVREIKEIKAKRDRLAEIVEDHSGDGLESLLKRLQGHERKLKVLRRRLKTAKISEKPLPESFTKEQVEAELNDLRELLNGEVKIAAPILAALTGPVKIREGQHRGRKGTPWIATFNFQPAAALARAARANCRWSESIWKVVGGDPNASIPVEIVIEKVPEYEIMAPQFQRLRNEGATVASIAATFSRPRLFVTNALKLADTGERPKFKAGQRTGQGLKTKYKQIASAVARLRDQEQLPWAEILERLKEEGHEIGENTARRAHDHAHHTGQPEEVISIPAGRRRLGQAKRLGREAYATMERLLLEGKLSVTEIAKHVGCSSATVYNLRRDLRRKDEKAA